MKAFETPQQHEGELARFIEILRAEGARSYLEIGSKNGGSLWAIANALPVGSQITSVDLPWGDRSTESSLVECCAELQKRGYKVHLICDDSTKNSVIHSAGRYAPYDAVFIDANHTEPYVRKDWANYGPMGRIVAFHDIGWEARPMPSGKLPIEVPVVWNEIKGAYRHEEIRMCPRDNGIGVLWRS